MQSPRADCALKPALKRLNVPVRSGYLLDPLTADSQVVQKELDCFY